MPFHPLLAPAAASLSRAGEDQHPWRIGQQGVEPSWAENPIYSRSIRPTLWQPRAKDLLQKAAGKPNAFWTVKTIAEVYPQVHHLMQNFLANQLLD
jgi:hypothetical protein